MSQFAADLQQLSFSASSMCVSCALRLVLRACRMFCDSLCLCSFHFRPVRDIAG